MISSQVQKTIHVDISDMHRTKGRSGIQRLLREYLPRLYADDRLACEVRVISFNSKRHQYDVYYESTVVEFLSSQSDLTNPISSFSINEFSSSDIFLDLDSAWNVSLKRPYLYRQLKQRGVTIITLIYDLVPVLFPQYTHENTIRNFTLFISAVYTYSDLVVCISRSTERDFTKLREQVNPKKPIPTVVVKLGGDFANLDSTLLESTLGGPTQNLGADFLDQRFYLFVGTIEPRKQQVLAVEAFEDIISKYGDVHLVIAGKQGWSSDKAISRIKNSEYFGTNIHWIDTPSDSTLSLLYEKCYGAIYLSHYEGFGLPIIEALSHGKPTISSFNSSLFEAGGEYADYVRYNTKTEIVETIDLYLSNDSLYKARQEFIKGFVPHTWQQAYERLVDVLVSLDTGADLIKGSGVVTQAVFISIDPAKMERNIALMDRHLSWIGEYLIVTPERLVGQMKAIETNKLVTVLADEELVAGRLRTFMASNHVAKNWMLRSSLAYCPSVAEEFIMLDDDNQPLTDVPLEYFKNTDGTYNGYYFYDLTLWPYYDSDYDCGVQHMKRVLDERGYEQLIYSSHSPQIINKALFREMIEQLGSEIDDGRSDEWSAYFNYVASNFPGRIRKRVFETLNWPSSPTDWQHQYRPRVFTFENYYQHLYDHKGELFSKLVDPNDADAKDRLKEDQLRLFYSAIDCFDESLGTIEMYDLAHGPMAFEDPDGDLVVVVATLPYLIATTENAVVRLPLLFQVVHEGFLVDDVCLHYQTSNYTKNYVSLRTLDPNSLGYSHGLASLPVASIQPGSFDLEYFVTASGRQLTSRHRFKARIVVGATGDSLDKVLQRL